MTAAILKLPLPAMPGDRIEAFPVRTAAQQLVETTDRLHRLFAPMEPGSVLESLGEEARACIAAILRAEAAARAGTIRIMACITVALDRWRTEHGLEVMDQANVRILCRQAFPIADDGHGDALPHPLQGADAALRRALALLELKGNAVDIGTNLNIAAAFANEALEGL